MHVKVALFLNPYTLLLASPDQLKDWQDVTKTQLNKMIKAPQSANAPVDMLIDKYIFDEAQVIPKSLSERLANAMTSSLTEGSALLCDESSAKNRNLIVTIMISMLRGCDEALRESSS